MAIMSFKVTQGHWFWYQ